MPEFQEEQRIISSWQRNAAPWITAIGEQQIASRLRVTNQAILDVILALKPTNTMDVGCGEGWLVDALQQHDIDTLGIDATAALVKHAQQHRAGRYQQLTYDQLTPASLSERFDIVVCNFSLLGKTSTEHVFNSAIRILKPSGRLVVQTLHPAFTHHEQPYEDGWRKHMGWIQ